MTNRQQFSSTPSVNQPVLRSCFILLLGFCLLQVRAQNPMLTTTNTTVCSGSLDLNSLITTNGTSITWSEKPQATAISAGDQHSLALLSDGTVIGWGNNSDGQSDIPAFAATPTAIVQGGLHCLALLSNGTVVGWGSNRSGNGQSTTPALAATPTAIAAGYFHSLALLSNGTVVGWGANGQGRSTSPVFAATPIAIAAGLAHSLALLSNGTVVGWGANFSGQTNVPAFAAPATAVAGGYSHSIALLSNGTVVGWGLNSSGQVTPPAFAATPTAIAAGGDHSLALLSNGTVVGWGSNQYGESVAPSFTATPTAIAAGNFYSLVLLNNGSIVGWGSNTAGRAEGYDALPLSNSVITPTSTKTYYVVVRNANGGKSTDSVTVTFGGLSLSPTTTNNALNFDGTNDAVEINNCGNNALTNTDALTIEYWFKGTSNHSAVRLQPDNNSYIIAGYSSGLTSLHLVRINNVPYSVAVGNATDGNWHHVAMTWQRNTTSGFKSYLDGALVAQTNTPNVALPVITSGMWLGSRSGVAEFTSGSLDEVRVWGVARTQAEIQRDRATYTLALPQTGLVVYYKFDHGTGNGSNSGINTIANSANTATFPALLNNFALTGTNSNWATSYDIATPATTTNNALNFDGTNDYVHINKCSGSLFTGGDALTIEYWFKGSSNLSAVRMQDNGEFIVAGWNGLHILSNDGGTTGISVGSGYTNGNWHHIAITWQRGGLFTSYLDGVQVAQRVASNTPLPTFSAGVYLGSFGGTSEFMNGSLDEVRVWTVARTATQIQTNMSACSLLDQTGLLMYYRFDHGTANGSNTSINTLLNSTNATESTGILNGFSLSTTSSNWTTGKSCGSVLPIELLDFKGTPQYNGNFLTWTTANEVNNKGFQMERSPQPPKGAFEPWDILGFVDAKGKAATYDFLDATPPSGAGGYYRLRQIDNDGKETLSKIISISRKATSGLKVYPNPTSNVLTIEINNSGDFQIINLLGQQVMTGKTPPSGAGGLDVSALPQGSYFLKVGKEQVKFVKQ
jgi:hypothetical protein